MSDGVTVRDAATAAVLRDGTEGLEVLLLRRHGGHVFGANAYVFPGGAVDDSDADAVLAARVSAGVDYARACLGETGRPLAFWLAAIRECFEEAGLLVGCSHLPAEIPADERDALNAGDRSWADVAARLELRFALDDLVYFAQWTTPPGRPRRYATRFFAARAPEGQRAACDGHETVDHWWAGPAAALASHDRGEIEMMHPTRVTLERLCDYEDVESALAGLMADGTVSS